MAKARNEGEGIMDIGYAVAQWIERMFSYRLGTDMYVGTLPIGTDKGVYIMRTSGELNMYTPMSSAMLDIFYKDTSASTAIANLEAIKDAIHRMVDTETDNAVIYSMLVRSDVEDMGRDQQSAKLFKFSVEVIYRNKSIIS